MIDLVDDEDAWDALNEAEGRVRGKGKEKEQRPTWVPDGMDPVLEELPNWNLLSEIIRQQTITKKPATLGLAPSLVVSSAAYHAMSHTGSNTILVLASKCSLLTEFLSTMNCDAPNGANTGK